MIRKCFPVRAAAGLLAGFVLSAASGWAGQVLFQTDFSNDSSDSPPSQAHIGSWSFSAGNNHQAGSVTVQADGEEWFRRGPANRYLRVRDSQHMNLRANLAGSAEVLTTSFEFIGRNTSNDNRWLNISYYAPGSSDRHFIFSLDLVSRVIRLIDPNVGYGSNNGVIRFDVILNNSASAVTYDTPDGGTASLDSNRAAVWANGALLIPEYETFHEGTGPAAIDAVSFVTDSAAIVSFDLDNFTVMEGAHVLADPPPPPTVPMVYPGENGALVYTLDALGNRIPDFSNAGYMGGGVPIPDDVPVRATVSPAPGDDTQRIQAAINFVSSLPLDSNGFRGAVLLLRGAYDIGGQLRITASGVVLRGEGDGEDGTVLNATGTSQRTLIEIAGSGSWATVPNTTRPITDAYVPVGARSFHVADSSPFSLGQTVIVHRPSTADWISAIGMDQIPPRSDGLPVTQWSAGAYDIRYDRVITGVEGNRITVDAPIVNSLDQAYGGGNIYRYTFVNRIAQVGIEDLRGYSVNQGGTDEDHSWRFITITAAQNVWVRRTTAVAFSFGNTLINSTAKWVTVEDSQMLDPVSEITGSRRYPFYISGQLCLVQRCFARRARHDYSTSSRTHGPNVFLQSSSVLSFSDSGPHHRWATGTLYDSLDLANADLNVQNRLNFGSGHGWAGANHVVWNCRVRRAAIQNPPTAQNWAIGVIGTKWAGSFPAYADDGYWISHNIPVSPDSLYLAQLGERLQEGGEGGLISFLQFTGTTPLVLNGGGDVEFALQRVGIRDRSVPVLLRVEGEAAGVIDWRVTEESLLMPAFQTVSRFPIALREDAFLPDGLHGTLVLRNGPGYSARGMVERPLFVPARPYDQWLAFHFSPAELMDPDMAGDTANPVGDGVPNLLKYALGMNPRQPVERDRLPVVRLRDGGLYFSYLRREEESAVVAKVEISDDLVYWRPADGDLETDEIQTDGEWQTITLRDPAFPDSNQRRFLRLSVSKID